MNTKLNKSDYILLALIYAVTAVFQIWDYYDNEGKLIEYLVDIPTSIILSFVVILLFMYWLIPRFMLNRPKYVLFTLLGVLILTVAGITEYIAGFYTGGYDWAKFPKWYSLMIQGLFSGSDSAGIVFGLLLTKKFYESQTQVAKIQEQQKENELKLLRSQLNPHFLFNNLNTLDALIDSDTKKAKEYINRLALIYRYLIQTKDAEVMELSQEMSLAENYIFLIKTRFGDDYKFQFSKNTDFSDKFLPTGALQTLLENVVKHNKSNRKETIHSSIDITDDWLSVTNQKSKIGSNGDSLGTGLQNLRSRYQLLSDETPKITDSETEFKIAIPIIKLSV